MQEVLKELQQESLFDKFSLSFWICLISAMAENVRKRMDWSKTLKLLERILKGRKSAKGIERTSARTPFWSIKLFSLSFCICETGVPVGARHISTHTLAVLGLARSCLRSVGGSRTHPTPRMVGCTEKKTKGLCSSTYSAPHHWFESGYVFVDYFCLFTSRCKGVFRNVISTWFVVIICKQSTSIIRWFPNVLHVVITTTCGGLPVLST